MLLAIDIGNTNIVMGLYEGDDLRYVWRIASVASRTEDEYRTVVRSMIAECEVDPSVLKGSIISSGVPRLMHTFDAVMRRLIGKDPMILTCNMDLGLKILYRSPEDVGPDRLANAVGVVERYGAPAIVVDFGTAITLDVITSDRAYLGGIIMPGLEMSADSLSRRTARLPRIAIEAPGSVVGRSTFDSINSGLVRGNAAAVDRLVELIREEIAEPECPVIATGGQAEIIAEHSHCLKRIDPDLTLFGMLCVFKRNSRVSY
jgi:type III pantothenate kinase